MSVGVCRVFPEEGGSDRRLFDESNVVTFAPHSGYGASSSGS